MNIRQFLPAVLASALLCASVSASEARVFTLSGAFDDGTSFGGSFETNLYGYLTDWDITTHDGMTNGGAPISGFEYTPATSYTNGCSGVCIAFGNAINPPGGAYYQILNLEFTGPLTAGVNTVLGGSMGPSYEAINYGGGPPGNYRYVASAMASGVPEASTWGMLLLGFAGLGLAGYRATRRETARIADF